MPHPAESATAGSADELMTAEFLLLRARCLEIAATLDRIDQAGGPATLGDTAGQMRSKIDEAIAILASDDSDRAARLQHLFSRPYDPQWRENLGVG